MAASLRQDCLKVAEARVCGNHLLPDIADRLLLPTPQRLLCLAGASSDQRSRQPERGSAEGSQEA